MPSRAFHSADQRKFRDPMKPEKERHNLPKVESIKTRRESEGIRFIMISLLTSTFPYWAPTRNRKVCTTNTIAPNSPLRQLIHTTP